MLESIDAGETDLDDVLVERVQDAIDADVGMTGWLLVTFHDGQASMAARAIPTDYVAAEVLVTLSGILAAGIASADSIGICQGRC